MSLPPLPDIFGNYALGDFAEVVAPAPVDWLPQTVGWAILAALLGLYLARMAWRRLRRWYRDRYRREAWRALAALDGDGEWFASEASALLKRTALAAFDRPRVAGLTGQAWVDFLNDCCGEAPFGPGVAEVIASGQYCGAPLEGGQREALHAACERWIVIHRGPHDA